MNDQLDRNPVAKFAYRTNKLFVYGDQLQTMLQRWEDQFQDNEEIKILQNEIIAKQSEIRVLEVSLI